MAVADPLHAADYELISPGGTAFSEEQYLGGIASDQLHYHFFEPAADIAVVMGGDVAVCVRYRARIDIIVGDSADRGMFWHTDIYRTNCHGGQPPGRRRHVSTSDEAGIERLTDLANGPTSCCPPRPDSHGFAATRWHRCIGGSAGGAERMAG